MSGVHVALHMNRGWSSIGTTRRFMKYPIFCAIQFFQLNFDVTISGKLKVNSHAPGRRNCLEIGEDLALEKYWLQYLPHGNNCASCIIMT